MKKILDKQKVADAIQDVANKLIKQYGSNPVCLIAIMNGGAFFAVDLLRRLPINFTFDSVKVRSYDGMKSSGQLEYVSPLPDVAWKHVILVDEICDSGLTLSRIQYDCLQKGALTCLTAVLCRCPSGNAQHIPDFCGIHFGEDPGFLVGCGMDWKGYYRQLADLYVLETSPSRAAASFSRAGRICSADGSTYP